MQGKPGSQITSAAGVEAAIICRAKDINVNHIILFHGPRGRLAGFKRIKTGKLFRRPVVILIFSIQQGDDRPGIDEVFSGHIVSSNPCSSKDSPDR